MVLSQSDATVSPTSPTSPSVDITTPTFLNRTPPQHTPSSGGRTPKSRRTPSSRAKETVYGRSQGNVIALLVLTIRSQSLYTSQSFPTKKFYAYYFIAV